MAKVYEIVECWKILSNWDINDSMTLGIAATEEKAIEFIKNYDNFECNNIVEDESEVIGSEGFHRFITIADYYNRKMAIHLYYQEMDLIE